MIGLKRSSRRPADLGDAAPQMSPARGLSGFRVLSSIQFGQVCAINYGGSL